MTESEWLVSDDPQAMLAFGTAQVGASVATGRMPGFTARKLRHFACACCRQVWDGKRCGCLCGKVMVRELPPFEPAIEPPTGPVVMPEYRDRLEDCPTCHGTGRVGGLTDPRSRAAVEVSERFADGEATEEDVSRAWCAAEKATSSIGNRVRYVLLKEAAIAASQCRRLPVPQATQAALLRCLVGNPFRPVTISVDCPNCNGEDIWFKPEQQMRNCEECGRSGRVPPSWLTTAVVNVAAAIYADRDWQALPVLCDALEEAGCDNADIIDHLRGPGPHARGCHVLDLILGKQ